jgi:hypothetical protein
MDDAVFQGFIAPAGMPGRAAGMFGAPAASIRDNGVAAETSVMTPDSGAAARTARRSRID